VKKQKLATEDQVIDVSNMLTIIQADMHYNHREILSALNPPPAPEQKKYCKDCVHCDVRDEKYAYAKCSYDAVVAPGWGSVYCETERSPGEDCGPEGKHFERKPEVGKITMIYAPQRKAWWQIWK
jgi:hypothetical protein